MKAISLWQPWASAIAVGLKTIETRHWWTAYRGPIVIHAAKRWTGEEREFAAACARHYEKPELATPPLGALVAVAAILGVKRTEEMRDGISSVEQNFGNYSNGRYGWLLGDIRALPEPIPFCGAQGFFDVPDELIGHHAPDLFSMAGPHQPGATQCQGGGTMKDMSIKLADCPFCGGAPLMENLIVEATIWCCDCGARLTRKHLPTIDTGKIEVAAAWNTRTALASKEQQT